MEAPLHDLPFEEQGQVPQLSLVLDSLPIGVVAITADGAISYANANAEAVFGASVSHLLQRSIARFLPEQCPILTLPEQVLKHRIPVSEYRVDLSSPRTGPDQIYDVHASPLEAHDGIVLLSFQARSLAERVDRQLTHRGAARSVTGLAAMLAHEIKNPLSGIRGAAQLIGSSATAEDQELTTLITKETDRIVKLVDRMEVFSDETPVDAEPVNLHEVFDHVKQVAKAGFGSHIRFTEQYDPSLPDVAGDRDQLVQVFLNLVKNACEVLDNSERGTIHLASAYRPGFTLISPQTQKRAALPLEFSVSDNGPGIDPMLRAHIFEPFVSSRKNGGGLGLALVAKIVGAHGGTVECDHPGLGGGSRFKVLLPAWKDRQIAGKPS